MRSLITMSQFRLWQCFAAYLHAHERAHTNARGARTTYTPLRHFSTSDLTLIAALPFIVMYYPPLHCQGLWARASSSFSLVPTPPRALIPILSSSFLSRSPPWHVFRELKKATRLTTKKTVEEKKSSCFSYSEPPWSPSWNEWEGALWEGIFLKYFLRDRFLWHW